MPEIGTPLHVVLAEVVDRLDRVESKLDRMAGAPPVLEMGPPLQVGPTLSGDQEDWAGYAEQQRALCCPQETRQAKIQVDVDALYGMDHG